jgi:hypothetical protein
MTEAEWRACADLQMMLESLRGTARIRKLRLFACACCRRIWHRLNHSAYTRAVELAERFADGKATREQLNEASSAAAEAANPYPEEGEDDPAGWAGSYAASTRGTDCGLRCAVACCKSGSWEERVFFLEERVGALENRSSSLDTSLSRAASSLLREVFGKPSCPAPLDPAWLTWRDGTIPKLAQAIYEDREHPSGHLDNHRLAVLADALEDAGCTDADILAHCRESGPHVRGCWVVDLLGGKE